MSQLLGYKNRTGWARIKGGIVPANKVFQMRAVMAFPELATAPSKKSKSVGSVFKDICLRVRKFV